VKHYVVLKTALSALTGGAVGIILGLCQVRLFVLFGLLTFLFNYIPNVGSMIAMVLPIPIIVVDTLPEDDFPGPEILRKAMAFLGPAIVQAYVGNVLEPAVFGKSLNVTAISVLIALVLWGAIWGLQGAILSVPLLAAVKVMLEEADHPMAKMVRLPACLCRLAHFAHHAPFTPKIASSLAESATAAVCDTQRWHPLICG
jgi:AI-2 transport protein TqsA